MNRHPVAQTEYLAAHSPGGIQPRTQGEPDDACCHQRSSGPPGKTIETALEHATSIANGYLNTHEGLGSAVWSGQAQSASVNTAVQINTDLQQAITGGTRLARV